MKPEDFAEPTPQQEPPAEATPAAPEPATDVLVLDTEQINLHLMPQPQEIQELRERFLNFHVAGYKDKANLELARSARMTASKIKAAIEARREEIKRPALEYGRMVDDQAKALTAQIQPVIDNLWPQVKAADKEKKRVRAEAERRRREKLDARIKQLVDLEYEFQPSVIEEMDDQAFEVELMKAEGHFAELTAKREEEARIAAEQEAKAQREAEEKAAAEKAERERYEAEMKKLREERAQLEAENARLHEEKEALKAAQAKPEPEPEAEVEPEREEDPEPETEPAAEESTHDHASSIAWLDMAAERLEELARSAPTDHVALNGPVVALMDLAEICRKKSEALHG